MSVVVRLPLPAETVCGLLPEAVAQVARDDVRVVLERDGQPVAAVVSVEDLHALEELEAGEDTYWERAAEEAHARWEAEGRPAGISHEEIARELGIDLTGTRRPGAATDSPVEPEDDGKGDGLSHNRNRREKWLPGSRVYRCNKSCMMPAMVTLRG
jgi:PHD/YefM family antitoxin component YafN of YafNO toxin-antitoxin module